MRPGVDVITLSQPPPRSAPTYTGVWFVVGKTASGPAEPTEIRSMKQYEDTFGARTGAGQLLYDCVDAFFREGGSRAMVSRVSGASPVAADYEDALALFSKTLGPGQVSVPGSVDPVVQAALLQHAADTNRVALLDCDVDSTSAQCIALADALRVNGRFGAIFGPWAVYPGVAAGTDRQIPYSAIEAGIIARNDANGNANLAAAGVQGQSNLATGLTTVFTDQEYADMNDAGFNAARVVYGVVETYGYRSLADQESTDGPNWVSFGWSRLNMEIGAQAESIGERYVFKQIDGRGLTIGQFGSELRAMLQTFYLEGALYGATPEDAFDCDVGAAGEHARDHLRRRAPRGPARPHEPVRRVGRDRGRQGHDQRVGGRRRIAGQRAPFLKPGHLCRHLFRRNSGPQRHRKEEPWQKEEGRTNTTSSSRSTAATSGRGTSSPEARSTPRSSPTSRGRWRRASRSAARSTSAT